MTRTLLAQSNSWQQSRLGNLILPHPDQTIYALDPIDASFSDLRYYTLFN